MNFDPQLPRKGANTLFLATILRHRGCHFSQRPPCSPVKAGPDNLEHLPRFGETEQLYCPLAPQPSTITLTFTQKRDFA